MRNLVAAFKDTIREEFLSGFIIKKVYDKNAIIRLHNLLLDDLEKFVRRADEDIEKAHKTVASQEYDEFALTVDVMLEKGIEHTQKTVELLTLCEGNEDWRQFLIEQLLDHNEEEKQEWLTQKEVIRPFNEIVEELMGEDTDTVRKKHYLTKSVLEFIYRLNLHSLLTKNPHADKILYEGKVDVSFPPLFEDSKKGVDNYIMFQAAVESICKNELERFKK